MWDELLRGMGRRTARRTTGHQFDVALATDCMLAAWAQEGFEPAWNELFRRSLGVYRGIARRHRLRPADHDDGFSIVFIRCVAGFQPRKGLFMPYFIESAKRDAANRSQREQSHRDRTDATVNEMRRRIDDDYVDPVAQMTRRAIAIEISGLRSSRAPRFHRWADIAHLHFVEGCEVPEVAQRLGLSPKAVENVIGKQVKPRLRRRIRALTQLGQTDSGRPHPPSGEIPPDGPSTR
jgi:RNA polymerase sigma factor (sigma-70 family)